MSMLGSGYYCRLFCLSCQGVFGYVVNTFNKSMESVYIKVLTTSKCCVNI